jgi:ankyrin repeat protein
MFSFIKKIFKGTLHKACYKGNIKAVKQHLADGAEGPNNLRSLVNAEDGLGRTPLLWAAARDRKEIAELLIAKGADVNAKAEDGWNALHSAASFDYKEIAELLITNGADVNTIDVDGETPLDYAKGETANLLRKHGGKTEKELKAEEK